MIRLIINIEFIAVVAILSKNSFHITLNLMKILTQLLIMERYAVTVDKAAVLSDWSENLHYIWIW